MENDSSHSQNTRQTGAIGTPTVRGRNNRFQDSFVPSVMSHESVQQSSSKYNFPGKKTRTQFTPKQLLRLEEKFFENQFPNAREREEIAEELELTVQHIQVWFQNRRAKSKRKNRRKQKLEKLTVIEPPDFWPSNLSFDSNLSKGPVVSTEQCSRILKKKKSVTQCHSTSEKVSPSPSTPSQTATALTSVSSPLSTCSTGNIYLQGKHSDSFTELLPEHDTFETVVAISSPSILAESPVRLYDILKDMPDLTPSLIDDPLAISTQTPNLPETTVLLPTAPPSHVISHQNVGYGIDQNSSIHSSSSCGPQELGQPLLLSPINVQSIPVYHSSTYTPPQSYPLDYQYSYPPQYPELTQPPPPSVPRYTLYNAYCTQSLPTFSQPSTLSQGEFTPSVAQSSHGGSHHCY